MVAAHTQAPSDRGAAPAAPHPQAPTDRPAPPSQLNTDDPGRHSMEFTVSDFRTTR